MQTLYKYVWDKKLKTNDQRTGQKIVAKKRSDAMFPLIFQIRVGPQI